MTGKMEDKGGRTEVKDKGERRWRKGVENGGGRRYDRGRHNIFTMGEIASCCTFPTRHRELS